MSWGLCAAALAACHAIRALPVPARPPTRPHPLARQCLQRSCSTHAQREATPRDRRHASSGSRAPEWSRQGKGLAMEALANRFAAQLQLAGTPAERKCVAVRPAATSEALGWSARLGSSRSLAQSAASAAAPTQRRPLAPRALAEDVAGTEDAEASPLTRKYPPFAAFRIHGTGRRKTAVARVGLIEGDGTIIVNGLPLNEYFQDQALLVQAVKLPLSSLGYLSKYDVVMKAHGGGLSAQAQAMMLGISRALVAANESNKPPLKALGMLTRDPRSVERKKYGLKKARKASQFSKR